MSQQETNGWKPTTTQVIVLTSLLLTASAVAWAWLRTATHSSLKTVATKTSPCNLALTPHSGPTALDQQIAKTQNELGGSADSIPRVERLGWLFVKKARISYDPGYYRLAEQCAACIESQKSGSQEALLLRAHVLQSLHHFAEAEPLARQLVATRGRAFDYGVLGDVLIDQGKLDQAVDAYQHMVDLRPDLQSYTRAAYVRWLTGHLPSALSLMDFATGAASPADSESAAWAYSRAALYQFQSGDSKRALVSCDAANSFVNDYAPALLTRGRILFTQRKFDAALVDFEKAVSLNELPEYQWYLADALRATGQEARALDLERQLVERGAVNDPRTLSVFLSTRSQNVDLALKLAQQELQVRQDVFTHDALAWSLAANGRFAEARVESEKSLKHNTFDARLSFHAGVIALRSRDTAQAKKQLLEAKAIEQMLTPSEREILNKYLKTL